MREEGFSSLARYSLMCSDGSKLICLRCRKHLMLVGKVVTQICCKECISVNRDLSAFVRVLLLVVCRKLRIRFSIFGLMSLIISGIFPHAWRFLIQSCLNLFSKEIKVYLRRAVARLSLPHLFSK